MRQPKCALYQQSQLPARISVEVTYPNEPPFEDELHPRISWKWSPRHALRNLGHPTHSRYQPEYFWNAFTPSGVKETTYVRKQRNLDACMRSAAAIMNQGEKPPHVEVQQRMLPTDIPVTLKFGNEPPPEAKIPLFCVWEVLEHSNCRIYRLPYGTELGLHLDGGDGAAVVCLEDQRGFERCMRRDAVLQSQGKPKLCVEIRKRGMPEVELGEDSGPDTILVETHLYHLDGE